MLKTLSKILIFIIACFCVVEQSFRVYVTDLAIAFNPARFNSMVSIMYTDLVEPSPYPEVFFQLKPNLDAWFMGRRFRTNSAGLADREYAEKKSEDVFRIAIIGSSWEMGSGVEPHQNYPARLEQFLNERYPEQQLEVVNFAVEMYGLREMVGTLRHRVQLYQPDLVIASITSYTTYVRWEEPVPAADVLPAKRNPFFMSLVLLKLDSRLGLGLYQLERNERRRINEGGVLDTVAYNAQIERAFDELSAMTKSNGVSLVVLMLGWGKLTPELVQVWERKAAEFDVTLLRPYEVIAGTPAIIRGRQVSRMDSHPNPRAHELIAERLLADIKDNSLIPGVE